MLTVRVPCHPQLSMVSSFTPGSGYDPWALESSYLSTPFGGQSIALNALPAAWNSDVRFLFFVLFVCLFVCLFLFCFSRLLDAFNFIFNYYFIKSLPPGRGVCGEQ